MRGIKEGRTVPYLAIDEKEKRFITRLTRKSGNNFFLVYRPAVTYIQKQNPNPGSALKIAQI